MKKVKKKDIDIMDIYGNPKYYGKHLIVAAGKVYAVDTGEEASKILQEIEKKHPEVVPQIAFKPKKGFLIL